MEEMCWKQFWETGKIEDYLDYRNILQYSACGVERNCFERDRITGLESEETVEPDYSNRDGFTGISYR